MVRGIAVMMVTGCVLSGAVTVDRISVIVGKRVVKKSDIERDSRLTQFLNRQAPTVTPAALRQSADRLVEQEIIHNEIAIEGITQPADGDADAMLQQLRRDRFGGSAEQMRADLARRGITEDQLRQHLRWELTVLRFIDQRFRPGVLVTDEDVRAYYNEHLADLRKQYPKDNSFEALEPRIRRTLEGEQINKRFEEWLQEARQQTRIEYREAAFNDPSH
jgi:peptidyl-prolyl cis-trans isomerase SurA